MENYTAEDGLNLLKYLRLYKDLSESQKKIFREQWAKTYVHAGRNPIEATKMLYVRILPYASDEEEAGEVSYLRERVFNEKVQMTKLEGILETTGSIRGLLKLAKQTCLD